MIIKDDDYCDHPQEKGRCDCDHLIVITKNGRSLSAQLMFFKILGAIMVEFDQICERSVSAQETSRSSDHSRLFPADVHKIASLLIITHIRVYSPV